MIETLILRMGSALVCLMLLLVSCVSTSTKKLETEMAAHPPEYIAESLTPKSEIKATF